MVHQGIGPSSLENVPVGPSGPISARRTGSLRGLLDGSGAPEEVQVGAGEPWACGIDLDTGRFEVGGERDRDGVAAALDAE